MSYADSHAHLDRYDEAALAAMLARAAAADVRALLTVGMDASSSRRALALAARFGAPFGVRAAVGLHPILVRADAWPGEVAEIAALAESTRPHAIGEIGADTLEGTAPLAVQLAAFRAQFQLAHRLGLPVILHVVGTEARAAVGTILAAEGVGAGAVVHYFVGDLVAAQSWLALGCHISVGRPATRPHEAALRAALASPALPLDRLLIETDTYPLPGRTTEPADVVAVAEAIATLKRLPLAEVATRTTATFAALFGG